MVCLVHFFETHIIKLAATCSEEKNPKNENKHRLKAVGTVGFSRGQITQAEESEAGDQRVHSRLMLQKSGDSTKPGMLIEKTNTYNKRAFNA